MKRTLLSLSLLMCLLIAGETRAQETLRVTFETDPPDSGGHQCFDDPSDPAVLDRNIVAVWLERHPSAEYVTTLRVWGETYLYNFEDWGTASGMVIDGVTGATQQCYTGQTCGTPPQTADAQLDTTAIDISQIPDGTYKLRMEITACEMADEYVVSPVRYDTNDVEFLFDKNGNSSTAGGTDFPFRNVAISYSGRSGNGRPGVFAGVDQRIYPSGSPARASTTLEGVATDDGGAPTTVWTQVSSEPPGGTATFVDASAVDTQVSFSHAGIYVLQLEASDGNRSSTDRVTIYVNTHFIAPTDDAEVNRPWNNNIAMGSLDGPLDYGVWAYSWGAYTGDHSRAYIRFDVSAVSGTANQATLRLPLGSQSRETSDVHDVYLLDDGDDGWSETTITFNNQPISQSIVGNEPLVGSYTHKLVPDPWFDFDVTLAFSAANHSNNVMSFFIEPRNVDGDGNGMGFASRENMIEPVLVVIEGWQEAANSPPTAVAAVPALVVDDGDGSESVSLDGSGSTDSDGQVVRWTWSSGGTDIASGQLTAAVLDLGIHQIGLEVEDNVGATATDSARTLVDDRFSGNDSAATARAVTGSASGQSYQHLFVATAHQGGGQGGDWFEVDLAVGADLSAELQDTDAAGDLDLRLFESDGSTSIDASTSAGSSNESVTGSQLAPGSYLVNVAAASGEADASRYSLVLTLSGAVALSVNLSPSQAPESAGVLSGAGTVSLPQPFGSDLTVTLSSSASGELSVPASVQLPGAQASVSFDLTLTDNGATDGNRVVTVSASAPGVLGGSADFTVLDDDIDMPSVSWSVAQRVVSEDDIAFPLEAVLSAVAATDVTVPFTVSGSATPGTDHDLSDGSLLIEAGRTSAQRVVQITYDQEIEGEETLIVTMGAPSGALAGVPNEVYVTIIDSIQSADAGAEDGAGSGGGGGGGGSDPEGCACLGSDGSSGAAAGMAALAFVIVGLIRRRPRM